MTLQAFPINMIASLLIKLKSRYQEFEADRYSVDKVGDASSLISALKKLACSNLSNLTPHWFHVFLHYIHPPMLERIEALRNYASKKFVFCDSVVLYVLESNESLFVDCCESTISL